MTTFHARYRLVTPLFSAGAQPAQAELRAPSFKGVLRFWWRALAWSRLGGDLTAIQAAEDRLFGSPAGRGRLTLVLEPPPNLKLIRPPETLKDENRVVSHGARYLGYGVLETMTSRDGNKVAGTVLRGCIMPCEFKVTFQLRGNDDHDLLRDALIALGTVGGFGARSRRGFGSLMLDELSGLGSSWRAPAMVHDLRAQLALFRRTAARPEYSAFSNDSRHIILTADDDRTPLALLDRVGKALARYRGWGRNGRIFDNTEPAEQNFKDDHDLLLQKRPRSHPRRVAFGLPHNYYYSSEKKKVSVQPSGGYDRRASPLFVHLHQCGDTPVAVLTLLPARFLPRDAKIDIGEHTVPLAPAVDQYRPVVDFLGRLVERLPKDGFTRAEEVQR